VNWHYEVPVGRGRRFGTNMNPVLNGVLGGWEFSGSGMVKTDRYRIEGAQLVGMTADEFADAFKISIERGPTGNTLVYSMPEDIRRNTFAAYNVDPTTPTGYSVAGGVPTGRYLKPASSADCVAIYRFDCNTPDINLNGPLFSRWDIRLKKQFPIVGRVNFEIMAEVLNVFDTINFNHSVNWTSSNVQDMFRVTSAFTDVNTTFDPGARVGQLIWRVNW
jgi:hypothetical protein